MSNQYNNGQESFNEIGCEQNVTDQSRDYSNVKDLPVTSESEVVSKTADLLDLSSETNVSNKSDDVVCIDLEPVTKKTETIRETVDLLEISSETNVVNKSGDVSCIKELESVTNKSEAMRKSVDFLEISFETNVTFDSEDAPCSKELESTNESKSSNSDTKKKVVVGSHINSKVSNQYNNGQESFNEIGCEENVTDHSRNYSNVKYLPVTSKSEVVSKPADLLDISSETNVSNKSDDVVCIDLEPVTNKTETIRETVDLLEISSETNVVNKSGDVSCIKELESVTNKSEAMRKSVDFLEISFETNVTFDSEDAPCSKELESTNESKSSNSDTKKNVVVGSHINSKVSNQYNNGQESFNEIGCEQNVTDQSRDYSDVKDLPVTSKSEVVSKPADLLDISSETNVSNKSDDVVCIDLEPVTNKSEAMRKYVHFLEISLETNVSFDSEDAPCSKELESTNESKSSNSDTMKKVVVGSHINSTKNDEEKSNHSLEYFVSCDPKENEDNNNPEWELLRKLQTDEERYKAVRMRWKNLVIPNPNQNLSYRFGGFKQPVNCNARKAHKRTHSATEIGNFNEPKRARTMSCTALFDQKVQERHVSMNQTIRRIENNAQQAVNDLNYRETWCFTYRPPGSRAEEIYRQAMHIQNIVELRRKYEMQVIVAMKEGEEEINALRNAMEEVRAFNSFYQDLEPGLENTVFLTPTELEELVEEDKLYEDFKKFYK